MFWNKRNNELTIDYKTNYGWNEFNRLVDLYISDYSHEYGARNATKIIRTIINSKHTSNLLSQSSSKNFVPNAEDFKSFVLRNKAFSSVSSSKIKFASVILLNHWHNDVNNSLNLISENLVLLLFNRIINSKT